MCPRSGAFEAADRRHSCIHRGLLGRPPSARCRCARAADPVISARSIHHAAWRRSGRLRRRGPNFAVEMVTIRGASSRRRGAKAQSDNSDVQSDTMVTPRNRSPDHRQQAVGIQWLLRQRADMIASESGRARQGSADNGIEHRCAQQGPHLHLHPVRPAHRNSPGPAEWPHWSRHAEGR